MDLSTVSPKYHVAIPKRVRERMGLKPGQVLQVIALPGRIELVPKRPVTELRGFLHCAASFKEKTRSRGRVIAFEPGQGRCGFLGQD